MAANSGAIDASKCASQMETAMDASRRFWLIRLAAGLFLSPAAIRAAIAQDSPRRTIEVRIEGRKVVEPLAAIRITEGEVVELRWTSDEAAELHLHGYDLEIEVRPDAPASMVVEAAATGRFPITSHGWGAGGHGHDALTYLEVYPR
jgi:FtsP/CotA-like multicopper oxidase with cupredoxin domain